MTLLVSFTKNNLIGLSFVAPVLCTLSSLADLTLSHLKLHSTLPQALNLVKYQTFDIPWRIRRAHVFPLIVLTGGSSFCLFFVISHQFAQRQTAIRWLEWLHRKQANVKSSVGL
jgi:hypothetical protein